VLELTHGSNDMPAALQLSGVRFGRLTGVEREGKNKSGQALWLCNCTCGADCVVAAASLANGHTKSCGCLKREVSRSNGAMRGESWRTHGMSRTKLYYVWKRIIQRCENPKNPAYKYYGGRGITVCKRWRNSFERFHEDMGPCPPGLQIDRIDNNGNYEPSNCRWATARTQIRNRRNSRYLTIGGIRRTVTEWAEAGGMKYATLWGRLKRGWSAEDAISTPV